MSDAPIDLDELAGFLYARARETPDEDESESIGDVASEVLELDSPVTVKLALRSAAQWSEHPDYRPEWRP